MSEAGRPAAPDVESLLSARPGIGLRAVHFGPDALLDLPELLETLLALTAGRARAPRLAIVADAVPKARGHAEAADLAASLCAPVGHVERVVIGGAGGRVHADHATVAEVAGAAAGADVIVTVGSGTVTDIGKAAAREAGVRGHVVVQTALSVNGYADDQSVLEIDGVKRTTPTRWPDVLIADGEVLAQAPAALSVAGVGDLLAMFTAPADWRLASLLGMDDRFQEDPVTMVRAHGRAILAAAPALRTPDMAAIELVARVLTLSGLSMGVAGTTAPASGAEHTMSHLLDMASGPDRRDPALHGAQVGVAAVVAAIVWRRVLEHARAGRTRLVCPSEERSRRAVGEAFGWLDGTGAAAAECWRDHRRKLSRWEARHGSDTTLDPGLLDDPSRWLEAPEALVDALGQCGAPTRFSELDPPVPAARARWALANCHLFRDRFTVVDLASFMGCWDEDEVESVLAEADAMGAGL